MNVRQLECFRAVMVTGTMTRAAETLGISQPAVSNLIAALEHQIGFTLFVRRKGRLMPTPEASYFYEEVNHALDGFERVAQTAHEICDRRKGQLVIASYPGIAIHFLPAVISGFMAERPDVRFKLLSRSSEIVRGLIPTQKFDLGIVELPVDHPGVKTEPMIFECRCAVPSGHPLAKQAVITPQDLDGVPFISLFREHMTYHRLARLFFEAGADWNVAAETQFFATCCAFVANGGGVALVDPFTAKYYEGKGLVTRRFSPTVPYELGLIYPVDRVHSRLAEAFVATFKDKIAPFLEASRAQPDS